MGEHPTSLMKAVLCEGFGGPERLKMGEALIPAPAPDEVQIQVRYAGVNPIDWKIREGYYKERFTYEFPAILGWDVAGTVSNIGTEVENLAVGDAVFAYCRRPIIKWGTYAEYVCYPAKHVVNKPLNLSFGQAAAIPLAGLTAWQALFDTARLKAGERILIQAGAGGVGSLAIQFAKQVGAHVITTASKENHDYVLRLGADAAIDYQTQNVEIAVRELAPEGVDVVFDTVGGDTLKNSVQCLKPKGRLVSIVQVPDVNLAGTSQVELLYHYVSPNGEHLKHIAELIENGIVQPIHLHEMPLSEAAEAQELNRMRHVRGKIVLKVR